MTGKPDAVLVLTFGGPRGPEDVMPFLRNVTAGTNVPEERLAAVAERYALFGGHAPINELSRQLVEALQNELTAFGCDLPVYWGTRNWTPRLVDTVQQMADDGIKRALVFTNSPFASYSGCRQYLEDLEQARATVGDKAPELDKLRLYFNHPGFIEPMAQNTMAAILEHGQPAENVRLVFTAHSLPQAMAEACDYQAQLQEAMELLVDRLGPNRPTDFELVYQSRSGPPHQPWLGPDILDYLDQLAGSRADSDSDADAGSTQPVTLVPIGFTTDHIEVQYELDTQAASKASQLGIPLTRAKTVGSHHMFIKMIRELIEEYTEDGTPLALGSMGPQPSHHGETHCLRG